jgi:hypothetical protein
MTCSDYLDFSGSCRKEKPNRIAKDDSCGNAKLRSNSPTVKGYEQQVHQVLKIEAL